MNSECVHGVVNIVYRIFISVNKHQIAMQRNFNILIAWRNRKRRKNCLHIWRWLNYLVIRAHCISKILFVYKSRIEKRCACGIISTLTTSLPVWIIFFFRAPVMNIQNVEMKRAIDKQTKKKRNENVTNNNNSLLQHEFLFNSIIFRRPKLSTEKKKK